jgi:SpoVK/Ycf46/Vps4 family AAA+-type ATPase
MPIVKPQKEETASKDPVKEKKIFSFEPQTPKFTFDDIILTENVKNELLDVLCYKEKSELVYKDWGLETTHKHNDKIAINLYGKTGTGKTMAAHAIASYFKKNIIEVNYAEIESKFVGETPKNLSRVFKESEESDSILFFDEADAMLSRRVTNMTHSTDTSVNQTRSVMLMLLNNHKGFIIFATNFIENYDPAFMRRILAHVHLCMPDLSTRKRLWTHHIPTKLPTNICIDSISEKFENISGSDIANAVLKASFKAARRDESTVPHIYFEEAITEIIESKNQNERNSKVQVQTREVSEDYVKKQLGNV